MYTGESLLDLHDRSHRSLQGLMRHCRELSAEELNRKLPGFGYPTVRLQLHHIVAAQKYWLEVIEGRYAATENEEAREEAEIAALPSAETLEAFRGQVAAAVEAYLRRSSPTELNTPREVQTWPNRKRLLMPARVFVRTMTHIFHHQGQVLAMCRLLGKPGPAGLDFPIE